MIVVVVIPSLFFGPSETRYFGKSGFSDYQDDRKFRGNVPKEMWTAACCTFQYKYDGRLVQRVQPFGGKTFPGNSHVTDYKFTRWMAGINERK